MRCIKSLRTQSKPYTFGHIFNTFQIMYLQSSLLRIYHYIVCPKQNFNALKSNQLYNYHNSNFIRLRKFHSLNSNCCINQDLWIYRYLKGNLLDKYLFHYCYGDNDQLNRKNNFNLCRLGILDRIHGIFNKYFELSFRKIHLDIIDRISLKWDHGMILKHILCKS